MTSPEPKSPVLTTEYIIILHDDTIERFGGQKGVLNVGTIDHLIYLLDNRKYDVVKKAAVALDMITAKHAFFDGNKRTGHLIANILLEKEGIKINIDNDKMLNALLKIANYECTVEEIATWLRKNIIPSHIG